MSEQTNISWTDSTWNPWRGCTKVSAGCANCYAETMSRRNPAVLGVWGPGKPRVRAVPSTFNAPLAWNKKPWVCDGCGEATNIEQAHWCVDKIRAGQDLCFHRRRVFSLSLGDWLDPEVPVEWLADMLDVIRRCPELDFQLLTKRPEFWKARIVAAIQWRQFHDKELDGSYHMLKSWLEHIPPPNIWLGVTCENQEAADRRIPELLRIPAKVRFLSVEPLLEPVQLRLSGGPLDSTCRRGMIDWVIVGGESGGNRRDCGVDAIVSVAEQCRAAGVPVFVKQSAGQRSGMQGRIPDNIWNLKQFPNIEQEAQ